METQKSKGMKALSIALVAASALVLTVIIIAFGGAAKRTDGATTTQGESTSELLAEQTTEEPAPVTEEETVTVTEVATTAEETTAEPKYELSFTSNGDGTCYVSGLGTYRRSDVEIPTLSPTGDIVTGIGGYAFYNKSAIARISLPSTIRTIGEYAFLGCTALCEITVSKNNTAFTSVDGILYSRDGTRLVCCPAMRGKTSCTIETAVSVIECGAFADVKNLREIHYAGTPEAWIRINVHAHNDLLDGIRLVCNYKE